MSGARKLQTEIDRVMKKIDEGVELFDEIWAKVYSAEQQNQKEKHEMDLKKEIKKLQRQRDQVKTWISSSEVKDKDSLVEARRLIETKMEQFKICEKETKTKTYSKEGLARIEKLSPEEEAKNKTTEWISQVLDSLQQMVDERDVEVERLSSGKGKKSNKHIIEEYNMYITNHKYHISKLEGIMRLVNNDRLETEVVDEIKEDLEYYIEAHEDDEYNQSYDEEMFYEPLGLEDLDVVNVDRLTQPTTTKPSKSIGTVKGDADDSSEKSGSKTGKDKKKNSSASVMIPLTIGRAKVSTSTSIGEKDTIGDNKTPKKGSNSVGSGRSKSIGDEPRSITQPSVPSLGPTPATQKIAPPAGASMAAILKRESEQQEKERQQKALQQAQQQQLMREQQAARAEQLRQQQLRQQQEAQLRQQQESQLRQQQQQQHAAAQAQQEAALKRQHHQLQEQARQQEAVAAKQAQQQEALRQQQPSSQKHQPQVALENLLTSGLGVLSLGANSNGSTDIVAPSPNQPRKSNGSMPSPMATSSAGAVSPQPQLHTNSIASLSNFASSGSFSSSTPSNSAYLGALNDSYLHRPSSIDSERTRSYTPRNPYPHTPQSYPTESPSPTIFENPAIFEKLGTDCLFFIFYYAQGTYQQYLAARELKKQSWRYHKKYMTWFQRHEEPKITTDEYEQGTYVYFDYETGWCQRIKSDFRFEYSFLEDSLVI